MPLVLPRNSACTCGLLYTAGATTCFALSEKPVPGSTRPLYGDGLEVMVPLAVLTVAAFDGSNRVGSKKAVLFGQLEIGGMYCQRRPRFTVSRRLTVQSS